MKKLKSIAIIVLSAMFATVATAQTANEPEKKTSEVSSKLTTPAVLTDEEAAAIKNILSSTPAKELGMSELDSMLFVQLVENNNDSLEVVFDEADKLCGKEYNVGEKAIVYIVRSERGFNLASIKTERRPKPVEVRDSTQVLQLDSARVNSKFVVNQRTGKPQYGVDYRYEVDGSNIKGEIPKMRQDKYGVSLLGGGDYNLGADVTSFGGRIGVGYSVGDKTGKWSLAGEVDGIVRRTRFNRNAEKAGEPYNAYASELKIMPGVALGKHGEWRLRAGGLLGWEYYETDSKETVLDNGDRKLVKSGGEFIYYGGLARLEYDSFGGPIGCYAEAGYRLHKSILQNEDMLKEGVWTFSLGVYVKIFRHESHF